MGCSGSTSARSDAPFDTLGSPPEAQVQSENSPSAAVPAVPEPINVKPPEFYITPESIYALLEPPSPGQPAPVKLLDSEWLLERADAIAAATTDAEREALALPRRQDLEKLHPEAFMSAEAIRELPTGNSGIGSPLAVGSISHAYALRAASHSCAVAAARVLTSPSRESTRAAAVGSLQSSQTLEASSSCDSPP